ncbi:MAG TPA: carbamoyl-phosphate synthase (glutamine-hydrolyzing) large subunit [Candidatus Acidoferrales bacterium]|nr:carbamoyl-phosphate synthase (glutamine-hydrolyzing) large subunit [Candidatus Acidoferrales bacterium]
MFGTYIPKKPRRALVLGSGALQIGQAGEFDYSGSQAIKALKEEGVFTVLVNPNIATIQTSDELADRIYLVAVTPEFVEEIIVKEDIDAIALSFGGQTALNCGLELHDLGVLERYGVAVMGTPIEAIRDTEDRQLFVDRLNEIGVRTARSKACRTIADARAAALEIGLPVMLRGGYALGGKGSGIVDDLDALDAGLRRAFANGTPQVLVEECLRGWKEIEYEVVRDIRDNCITVCNMENLDPMGIHTGESIVVAPSQTLNDDEYQMLRSIALKTIRHLGIVGECNIQYALDPKSLDYRVIEVNARLSRSSALASKATGYPLAYVAAKLALGYTLAEIPNGMTRRTTAFFEPALDYIVCKVPRWDLTKFQGASMEIGSEMKSVGEVMAIGRTFPEAFQKALRMLDIGVDGLDVGAFGFEGSIDEVRTPTPYRSFAIATALRSGVSIDDIHRVTCIDRWFLSAMAEIVRMDEAIRRAPRPLCAEIVTDAKRLGFSDRAMERLLGEPRGSLRDIRRSFDLRPGLSRIDTLAGEFPADTNYLYASYHASTDEVAPSRRRKVIVLGSGAYRIGSSVEFDWCAVNAVKAASELGYETIMVNYNPETVSTDYDVCDKLVFDEISVESILDLYERERPEGVIVSMGGQIPNNLALQLHRAGVKVLGTSPESIDRAEDRRKFSLLLDELGIDQPPWFHVTNVEEAGETVEKLGGYPVLVRPSYVLSGAAMSVAHEGNELLRILERAKYVSREHPVVVSKFETRAREVEIDAVADKGELVLWAISEHIEDAGVHSGDATLVLPPQTLYIATIRRVRQIAAAVARALAITGPFNMQFLAKHNAVKVIECNLRASRSFPFVSKVTGQNFAREATRRMLGHARKIENNSLELDFVGVKVPMFSFARLHGADPMLGVEMASTGEVGCLGRNLHEALLHGLSATGFRVPQRGVLLSLGPWEDKFWFTEEAHAIAEELGLPIYATEGTARMLTDVGVPCTVVGKLDSDDLNASYLIDEGLVDLVINVPRAYDEMGRPDGYMIRRRAIDAGITLITDRQLARALVEALRWLRSDNLHVVAWNDFHARSGTAA